MQCAGFYLVYFSSKSLHLPLVYHSEEEKMVLVLQYMPKSISVFSVELSIKGHLLCPFLQDVLVKMYGLWCSQNVFVKFQLKIPHS